MEFGGRHSLQAREDALSGFLEDSLRRDIMDDTGNVPKKRRNRSLCYGAKVICSCFYAMTVHCMSTPRPSSTHWL